MEGAFAGILVVSVLGFIIFSFVLGRWLSKRMLHGSPQKRAQAEKLMATGAKARATIQSIEPTGTVLNHINIQCRVQFRLDPLDGSPTFDGEKTFYINQTRMPRVGDVWPAWYDRDDSSTFGVGQPDLSSPEAQQTLRDFGIANPLDASASVAESAPASADAGDRDDRIVAIEQLGDLRARGLLTDAEFEAEKRRLLES